MAGIKTKLCEACKKNGNECQALQFVLGNAFAVHAYAGRVLDKKADAVYKIGSGMSKLFGRKLVYKIFDEFDGKEGEDDDGYYAWLSSTCIPKNYPVKKIDEQWFINGGRVLKGSEKYPIIVVAFCTSPKWVGMRTE